MKILLVVIAVILIGGGGYLLGQQPQKSSDTPPAAITPTTTAPASTSVPTSKKQDSSVQVKNALETSFKDKNFGNLKSLMAESVAVIKEGTSCCGEKTPGGAVDFISGSATQGGNWDFELTDKKYKSLTADPELQGHVMAVSSSGVLLRFVLDPAGKISEIYYYTSYKILVP